jgi:hypothetical protein
MMESKSNMISPTSTFRQRWDIIQAFVLAYVAISVPYRICFDDAAALGSFWFIIDVLLDIYFIVDVFLNFRTVRHLVLGYRPRPIQGVYNIPELQTSFTTIAT